MRFTAEVRGDEHSEHLVRQLAERARDPKPVLHDIADLFQRGHARNFSTSGSYLGTSWPANASSTRARKEARGQDLRPNRATGALERALAGRGRGKLRRVSKTRVSVGTTDFKARFAQGGTTTQPARPVLGISRTDRKRALSMVERFLLGG